MIKLNDKKYILCDVDGTIVHSCCTIDDLMARKIEQLDNSGYTFGFISGTNVANLTNMLSKNLDCKHYLLGNTGTHGVFRNNSNSEEMYNDILNPKEQAEIISVLDSIVVERSLYSLTTREDQIQMRGSQITFSILGRNAPKEAKASYDINGYKRKELLSLIKQSLGDRYDYHLGGTTSIDITKKGVDKAYGIKKFADYLNLSLDNIIFFGDKLMPGGNDYPAKKVVECISVNSPEDTLKKFESMFN